MQKIILNQSNIEVTRLCFGALTVGPLQANLSPDKGGEIIAYALDRGVNFVDTAQLYRTYPHVRRGLEISKKFDTVIASKTYAYDKKGATLAVEEARRELNRDYIDIFLLHEQENEHTLAGHREALEYLCECRERGIIRAVGISTHHVAGVSAAANMPEIDIIHPMINKTGLGIVDGGVGEMLAAIEEAHKKNIGIYAMKVLGGGNLINDANSAIDFALNQPYIHSIAIGMQSTAEVDWNVEKFAEVDLTAGGRGRPPLQPLSLRTRKLHIDSWCSGCGACVSTCGQGALETQTLTPLGHPLSKGGKKLVVDADKCVLCGYCAAHCEDFCIKIL